MYFANRHSGDGQQRVIYAERPESEQPDEELLGALNVKGSLTRVGG